MNRRGFLQGIAALALGTAIAPITSAYEVSTWLNVKDFGAVGDGVTDDIRAIEAAIDAAAPGQYVYFPPGEYRVPALKFSFMGTRMQGEA